MRIVYYGPGDVAWVEPDTESDREVLLELKDLTVYQLIWELQKRGIEFTDLESD